ncbi:outer membrane usher protein [Enterobacter asburiae]|jgi:outer membrane usher protein FimD/PapC|uniref:outer membrane usher protein n=1 Tax=Enterobacter asburiae TaxID=61645 RepID=UPI002B817E6C|nr:outer membrane usher protein [Enterobacter asburiae]
MTDRCCKSKKTARVKNTYFKISYLAAAILGGLISHSVRAETNNDIQFNTDVMDVKDRANIDLTHFARAGYIMPGDYKFIIHVNKTELPELPVTYLVPDNDPKGSIPCLTKDIITQFGLKEKYLNDVTWWHDGKCAKPDSIPGMVLRGDLGANALYVSIPQAYLEYSSDTWDPPSRWDNGIPGVLLDYNINADTSQQSGEDSESTRDISGSGTAGANLGPWRLRADWQYQSSSGMDDQSAALQWTRYYLYRALPSISSKLTMGQNSLTSSLFDSFQFMGANLASDDSMIPPNVRGYAPEVNGVARTNAKVTISQQGRVIYETQVPAGPFSIQDLSDSVTGKLDVKVEEQDGNVQTYQVNTASIPYLSRPGALRYSLSAGKPTDWEHSSSDEKFATGEFSWGVSNGWSLYGGLLMGGKYNEAGVGIGRDLLALGAISADITQSSAEIDGQGNKQGQSFRLSYSKRFDEYDSQITFAGYRFAGRDFMSMSEFLDATGDDSDYNGADKQLYTITFNKQFRDLGLSMNVSYSHQTYWDRPVNDNWNISMAKYVDFWGFKNASFNITAYKNTSDNASDKGAYLSLTLPFGDNNTLSYNGSAGDSKSQSVGWYSRVNDRDSYQINAGVSDGTDSSFSGYYTHDGDWAESSVSGSYQQGSYSSVGVNLQGGMTVTGHGAALHRINTMGGTRMMVDTEGVGGVPVSGNGSPTETNMFGKAVIADVNSYYRNTLSIDVNKLGKNVEASQPVVQDTLTEGAIGYRKFGVISGRKLMAVIRLADGSTPPFGATVMKEGRETGIVGDDGNVWLVGVEPGKKMEVSWDDGVQCIVTLPDELPGENLESPNLLLPCKEVNVD